MTTSAIIAFAGGVGLLLLGMRLMTDGLRMGAGPGLRDLLARGTDTRLRAVASGAAITAVVQSSSAVTFATIGFVNAGLLSFTQAVGVVYGANLGTTATSWLVALVGFKLDIRSIALPAIALGMALRIGRAGSRAAAFGEALAGFGVFFIGIDFLKGALGGVDMLGAFEREHPYGALPFVLLGLALTVVLQSSSATLAIVLSAAATGVLPLTAAAAMVIGANVGTTSTALLAVIGATPAAKRAAAVHVTFNAVVALVAMAALPAFLWVVQPFEPATALAAFHTLTKLAGIAVIWPLTPRLIGLMERRFRRADEDRARPRHLDRNVAAAPALGIEALHAELRRVQGDAREAATIALSAPAAGARVGERCDALEALLGAVHDFAAALPRDATHAEALARALRIAQYLDDVVERLREFERLREAVGVVEDAETVDLVQRLRTIAIGTWGGTETRASFEHAYADAKARVLRAGAEGRIAVRRMSSLLDQMSALRRLVDQDEKAARLLAS